MQSLIHDDVAAENLVEEKPTEPSGPIAEKNYLCEAVLRPTKYLSE